MLEPTYEKPDVQPHSYTLTSKRSLAIRPELISAIIDLKIMLYVSQIRTRGAKLPKLASFKTGRKARALHMNLNRLYDSQTSSRRHAY
jgi:hypothetical protein